MSDLPPAGHRSFNALERAVPRCRRCRKLRTYCAEVGQTKRRAFADWDYWARPVPGFGDHRAPILIAGLAPAAHGANRTGRMFTGDRSGDFLYAALHRAKLANQSQSTRRGDGLTLRGAYITAALRCAPPQNRPTSDQLAACRPYLAAELRILRPRVVLCLGHIAWNATIAAFRPLGEAVPSPKPRFTHAAEAVIAGMTLLGSYHVSQQNTFTGRLTEAMLDEVLARARTLAGLSTG
ncbi:MAG: uracil-DNA glycosylase [Phycisphaerales bacterium]|nr:MAG: uracil-DNA glycosylase [Phycisphaerales bacterium]